MVKGGQLFLVLVQVDGFYVLKLAILRYLADVL